MTLVTKATRGAVAGSNSWTNPGNATSDNASYATCAPGKNANVSGDWDFAALSDVELPVGATINSVTIRANYKVSVNSSVASLGIQAGNNGSFDVEETDASEPLADANFDITFNTPPSEADLKTAGRIVARIRGIRGNSNTAVTFSLDYVELQVDYTPAVHTVGQVTETDSADAVSTLKVQTAGQNTETDLAQAIAAAKGATVAQITETEVAQPVAWEPQRLVGQLLETDVAETLSSRKTLAVGQVTQVETAQAVVPVKQRAVGQSTESSVVQGLSALKRQAVAQTTETDLAQACTARKAAVIAQAVESDLAQAVTDLGAGQFVAVGQVVETDLAHPIAWSPKARSVGQMIETDLVFSVQPSKGAAIGAALETNEAFDVTAPGGYDGPGGVADSSGRHRGGPPTPGVSSSGMAGNKKTTGTTGTTRLTP